MAPPNRSNRTYPLFVTIVEAAVFFKKPEILTLNWYFIVEASKTVLWIVDPLIVFTVFGTRVRKSDDHFTTYVFVYVIALL
jgi:hypothetical protein